MPNSLGVNDRVRVNNRHWKCAGEQGRVVAFDPGKVNKYLVHFEREIPGLLDGCKLWLGDQDLHPAD